MRDPITRLNAALKGRYSIERELGEGGMATVYLADDVKHRRKVAVKVLRPELAVTLGPERFMREIEIAAGFSHPNILPLHDSGEADGLLYFVMPYVEGESLRQRLDAQKRLPLDEVLEITREVADALDYAHSQGLVHRDIKPGNILFQAGHAVVSDFGIARALSAAGGEELTRTGVAIGTIKYMSPEQAAGDAHVDARTDVYALGCVLYEMLSGEAPYSDGSPQAILARKIAGPVPGLRGERDDLPASIEEVVTKALASEADDRFGTAGAFSVALIEANTVEARAAADRRTGRARRRRVSALAAGVAALGLGAWWLSTLLLGPAYEFLAVLPPTDLTNDPDQQYLLAGVHDGLITELQRAGVRVIAASSVIQFASDELPAREIADGLGVDAVIETALSRVADSVGLDLRLVDGTTDELVWFASYGGRIADIPMLYREATRAIVDEIELALTPEAEARLAGARPVNPEAYEAYLRGQFHLGRQSASDLDAALQYFDLALEKDPSYAVAYVGIAQVWSRRELFGIVPPDEARPRVKAAAQQAIRLDSTLVEAQHRLASIRTWEEWDWEGGEAGYQRVIQLNPNYPAARRGYASLLEILGRLEEAMVQIERALEVDPFNEGFQGNYGAMLIRAGRYDEGIAQIQNALKTAPNAPGLHAELRDAFLAKGMNEEALTEWKWLFFAPGERGLAEAMDRGYAEGGFREAVRRTAEMWAARSDTIYVPPLGVAALFAAAGEHDRAIDWLERGVQIRNTNIPGAISIAPIFDSLHDDPRFQALRRRMNLPD